MKELYFTPEILSLGVFIIILLYMRGMSYVVLRHSRDFFRVILVCICCLSINIISSILIVHPTLVPLWFNNIIQLIFFAVTPAMPAAIVYYIMLQVGDELHDYKPFLTAKVVFCLTLVINLVFVVLNPWYHFLYSFTPALVYTRGPVNFLTMILSAFYVIYGLSFYLVYRKYISPQMMEVLKWFPFIAIFLMVIQTIHPNLQLGGTAAMFTCLVCYLNFQSTKLTTDSLTQCGNRFIFLSSLSYFMKHKQELTLIALNIRQFKKTNEEFGMVVGDQLLRYIGATLRSLPFPGEVFRIGGDKFVIICQKTRNISVDDYLGCLKDLFRAPWTVETVRIMLEVDLVSMNCPEVASNPDEILSLLEYSLALPADVQRENDVPDQVEVRICDVRMRERKVRREEIITLLRKSLLEDWFYCMYQPIFDIDGKHVVAAECLLRLNDPTTGKTISPGEFIPYAEKAGLIPMIGLKVFETVCRFIHNCNLHGIHTPPISVNFSTRQFYNQDIDRHMKTILGRWNVSASAVKIEVTESTFISNFYKVEEIVNRLVRMGFGFYLDDFGTGYSSFSRMMTLPFECVKFDQSILNRSQREQRLQAMLKYLVQGFGHLNTRVVIEGVETQEQLEFLRNFDVTDIQGYLYSRPLPERVFFESLERMQENGGVWVPPFAD